MGERTTGWPLVRGKQPVEAVESNRHASDLLRQSWTGEQVHSFCPREKTQVNDLYTVCCVTKQNILPNSTDKNGEDLPEEKTSSGPGNGFIYKTAPSIIRKPEIYSKQFRLMCFSNVEGELPQSDTSVSGQNEVRANGNKIPAGSTTEKNEAMMENIVSTGSAEGNQGTAGSTDGKKIPTGSGNDICTGSLVYDGVSSEHAGGNKDHMTPAEDRKEATGSAVSKKAKCQRQRRKAQQRTPAQGRFQQRTSNS